MLPCISFENNSAFDPESCTPPFDQQIVDKGIDSASDDECTGTTSFISLSSEFSGEFKYREEISDKQSSNNSYNEDKEKDFTANICTDCGKKTSRKSRLTRKSRGACENDECNAFLCRICKNKYVIIPRPRFCVKDNVNPHDKDVANEWRTAKFHRFCRSCYMEKSIIDFDTNSFVFDPPETKSGPKITLIMAHGAGGSRATFITHAREMAKHHGFRCIVMDLAGHGARWNEKCTVSNCIGAIKEVLETHNIGTAKEEGMHGRKTLFVASSWGGYIGYDAMGELSEYFSGLITDSSMINFAKVSEKIKWATITSAVNHTSNYTQLRFLRKKWNAAGKSYMDCVEAKFGAGIFGYSNPMQTMVGFDFKKIIPKIKCPILFLCGTADPDGYSKKCEELIFKLIANKEHSKVVMFDEGDHLFSHDYVHFQKWIDSTVAFAETIPILIT